MTIKVPNFGPIPGLTAFLNDLVTSMEKGDKGHLKATGANNSLLLYSPNKSVFEIKVSDAGAITATKIAG
jgi:hypothetical protein